MSRELTLVGIEIAAGLLKRERNEIVHANILTLPAAFFPLVPGVPGAVLMPHSFFFFHDWTADYVVTDTGALIEYGWDGAYGGDYDGTFIKNSIFAPGQDMISMSHVAIQTQ